MAELPPAEKNEISHRGRAALELAEHLVAKGAARGR
jgi:inosine/xanthosine triphosphate pyrophosphatase family protein